MMKHVTILLAFVSASVFGQKIEKEKLYSKALDQERVIWVYTPWQYEEFPEKEFEVIYVFDAQIRAYFDLVHSTLQFLEGQEYAFIVVGIESPFIEEKNQSRNTDFLPEPLHKETLEKYGQFSGGADKFLSFVRSDVIPLIDKKYRTLPERVAVGHSNGGTFISYCLLKEPALFNALIAISPNYAYDDGQMIDRFEKFSPADINAEKFIYLSNSNERATVSPQWKGWSEAREKIVDILKNEAYKSKIHLVTKDFSDSEDHSSTVPVGVFYGLKAFIDYQFRTGDNIIHYYSHLANNNLIHLNQDLVNNLAYECFWHGKTKDAITVIKWAIKKFPDENNLYDSQGEFYEKLGDFEKARDSFQNAMDVLAGKKEEMKKKEYDETMDYYKGNLQRVSN